mgnify:CR=1 FL=1
MRARRDPRLADDGVVDANDVVAARRWLRRRRRPSRRGAPPMTVAVARASRGIARLGRLGQLDLRAPSTSRAHDRAAEIDPSRRRAAARRARRRSVLASGTVGPDAITLRSSPTTSEITSARHAPGVAAAEPPALDRRQVLADGVERVDVGAGAKQRRGRAPLVVERQAGRRAPPSARMRRRTAGPASGSSAAIDSARPAPRRPPASLPAVGTGWPPMM